MAFFDDINDDEPQTGKSSKKNDFEDNNKKGAKDTHTHQDFDLGEAPEFPPIFFTYDSTKNKFEVRDRRGNVKADFDVMTVKGASTYEIWKEGRAKGEDTSYTAYLQEQKGKDGKNAYEEWKEWQGAGTDCSQEAYWAYFKGAEGKSAFDLWKEVHGEKTNSTPDDFFEYLKGKNGKDAFEVWQDLGYKNSSREDFFKWIASLVETQKGEDGKIFYPHFDSYTLYYTEDIEGKGLRLTEKDVRGKDGRTFEPKFEGTKLHFDDNEGHTTDTVELRGKDAFELWKEHEHKPNATFEEYLEFFKGQNVKSNHSYLDIKDYTCPVQTIDTDLIANVLDSGHSPDELIKLRQGDIDRLRKEGDERNNKCYWFFNGSLVYKNWAGWFKEFSWWCAGADRPLLRMCKGDHSKYTGIGTVILFTALMAWFSSFVAMQLVFKNNWIAATFATFWSMMIFFLDRFITNTMYSDGKVSISKDELIGGLPRILIAIFLGIVISAPLEIKIFDKEIDTVIHGKHKEKYLAKKQDALTDTMKFWNDSIMALKRERGNVKQNINIKDDLDKEIQKKEEEKEKEKNNVSFSHSTTSSSIKLSSYVDKKSYNKAIEDAKDIDAENTAKRKQKVEQIVVAPIDSAINTLQNKRNQLKVDTLEIDKYISEALAQKSKDSIECRNAIVSADSLFSTNIGLKEKLSALHTIATQDYESWDWCGETMDTLLHAWWWYLFNSAIGLIMLLFILIDISPVLYKMMLADGVYDNYLHQEKLLAQDKIRLSLARMLRNIEKGELKSLSPFIMGKIYRKLMKFSASNDGKYNGEDKDYKQHINWENAGGLNTRISETNQEVFETVLDYKRRIVLASYAAWYRDMRDAMIGAKDDENGEKITPDSHFHEKKQESQIDEDLSNQENSNDEAETINPTENTETV